MKSWTQSIPKGDNLQNRRPVVIGAWSPFWDETRSSESEPKFVSRVSCPKPWPDCLCGGAAKSWLTSHRNFWLVGPMRHPNAVPWKAVLVVKWRFRKVAPSNYGFSLILSFTAPRSRCLQPRYRSVVSTETCPSKNWICSSSPPAAWHKRAHVRRQSWGDISGIPTFAEVSFTTCQITFSVMPSPQTVPVRLMQRNNPSAIGTDLVPAAMADFSQCGTGTVRMCAALPMRSAMTQCSSLPAHWRATHPRRGGAARCPHRPFGWSSSCPYQFPLACTRRWR